MTSRMLKLRIPGSTANLGPGFDAVALSLGIYLNLTFELLEKENPSCPLIQRVGEIAQQLPGDQSNLIYSIIANQWSEKPDLLKRLRITIESEIPLERGLGSSSTAILGSLWAARALSNQILDKAAILQQATKLEGHPDNLAASLHGGLTISSPSRDRRHIVTQQLAWPKQWHTIIMVPSYPLSTRTAREILPATVSMSDAVANLQRVALLIAAVANEDEDALNQALEDRLHEPYREALIPELPKLKKELKSLPILGCTISGAGPSMLVLVNHRHRDQVLEHLRSWASAQPSPLKVLDLKVDHEGMKEIHHAPV